MNFLRITAILSLCFFSISLFGQKKLIKKANELYNLKQYTDAIQLYEQALKETDNLSATTKLANAYRMTNQTEKAESWYSKIVENPKAKPKTYYLYAESLMSNGKYELAKSWFLKYSEKEPEDQDAVRMAYACERVKTLEPYFPNLKISNFAYNSDADDGSPVAINGGIVFTSDRQQAGINPLKQKSGWTGRDYQRIYFSSQRPDGNYDKPSNFSKKLNELNMHCGPVSFSADKQLAIFSRTSATPDKNNTYNIQLYSAISEDGAKWKKVELVNFCKPEKNYMHPALSPDGKQLYFVSDKGGGLGGTDIYVSEKKGEKWSTPKNLGPVINTPSNEAFPFFHESGKLFFASKGHLSFGGYDLLFSNLKEDHTWQKPVNIGRPINSSQDDIAIYLNADLESGFFVSSREGGDDDIYIFEALAGTNADLENIDFDDASNEGPVIEQIKLPVNAQETEGMATNPTTENTQIEQEPIQIKTENIRSTSPGMEAPRDKDLGDMDHSPILATADKNIPLEETSPVKDTEQLSVTKPVDHNSQEQQITLPAARPVANEEQVEYDEYHSSSRPEPLIKNKEKDGIAAAAVEPTIQTPQELTNDTSPSTSSASSKKRVNLLIPAKKIGQEKEQSTSQKIAKTESKEKIYHSSEGKSSVVEIEEASDLPTEEVFNENTQILDRTPADSNPPTLLEENRSIIAAAERQTLTNLAERLQSGQVKSNNTFEVEGLNYSTGSFLLSPESTRSLIALTDLLERYPDISIEIGSHTSAQGDDIENHNLSTKRAMSIKAYLIYKGISGDRIVAKGYGETSLRNSCSNGVQCPPEAHEENDRVEIRVQ